MNGFLRIRRALISVSDKRGIAEFARSLNEFGIEIISTGGTFKALTDSGVAAKPISEVTGFPEILDGRVKTLHPHIHAGLLAVLDKPDHVSQLKQHNIDPIDLVLVNLYPFETTVLNPDVSLLEAIENIDIGGPAMVRASAKNYQYTAVVVNPNRYESLLQEMRQNGGSITSSTRFSLACEAFQHTAHYDAAISLYLSTRAPSKDLPDIFTISERKSMSLRYGENPHQSAALYGDFDGWFEKLHGKELSFNNILDLNAAVSLCAEFEQPTVVIIKHNNPCGVASGAEISDAYKKALATDPKSAFGGIVAFNRPPDKTTAEALNELFLEVIIAPEFPEEVMGILTKKKDRRLIRQKRPVEAFQGFDLRKVLGGYLVQGPDDHRLSLKDVKSVTRRKPTDSELQALMFAWRVAKHVKSNAIVYARGDRTLGIGAGQMSRVDSSKIAALKTQDAGLDLRGCSVASDAFFPFADGLLEAVKVGATAVIQPGGSIRDEEVIQAADKHDIAMLFTGIRHFRH